MKRVIAYITCFALAVLAVEPALAQNKIVENRPYTDLRPFHFGVLVGTHFQDIEFQNVGPQMITYEEGGEPVEKLITCDQDRWDAGFHVGVLGEVRLGTYFAFRIAPAMYFGTRHLTFHNFTDTMEDGTPIEEHQEMKSVYISTALDLIYSAKRLNNYRPYVVAGLNPMLNLSGKDTDILKLKRYDCYLELGLGCDFYLPFFKLRPELKFGYSLVNSLNLNYADNIKDKNMLAYSKSVNNAQTKYIALTFHFE